MKVEIVTNIAHNIKHIPPILDEKQVNKPSLVIFSKSPLMPEIHKKRYPSDMKFELKVDHSNYIGQELCIR